MNMERSDHELVTVNSSHLSHHSHHSEKAASHHDLEEHGEAPAPAEPGHDSQPNGAVPPENSEYPGDPGHHEDEEHPPGDEVPAEEHHDEQPPESVNGDQAEKPPGEVLSAVHEDAKEEHPGDPPGDPPAPEGDQVENPEQTVTADGTQLVTQFIIRVHTPYLSHSTYCSLHFLSYNHLEYSINGHFFNVFSIVSATDRIWYCRDGVRFMVKFQEIDKDLMRNLPRNLPRRDLCSSFVDKFHPLWS